MFSIGHANVGDLETTLREVAKGGGITRSADLQFTMTAIQLGGRPLGSLGVVQGSLSDAAMQAIAQLAAIAIERAREQKAASRVEAARQSEQLKSTLLDALAHEFKTPLTSIKAASTTSLARGVLDAVDQDLVTVIDEETDRMTDLVTQAIELGRLSGGQLRLNREACAPGRSVAASLRAIRARRDAREFDVA